MILCRNHAQDNNALLLVVILALVILSCCYGYFLLLDHKDEHTLNTIAVTPVGVSGYLKFKMVYILDVSCRKHSNSFGTKLIAGDKYTILNVWFSII